MVNAVASTTTTNWWVYAVYGFGILAGSTGPIFLRLALAEGVPTPVITVCRLMVACLLLTPLTLNRYQAELRRLSKRDVIIGIIAGILFAAQMILMFEAYVFTSVLIAGVLIGSIPLWTLLMERFILHAHFNRMVWIGLGLALVGGALIGLAGIDSTNVVSTGLLLGGSLALAAALMGSLYLILGRTVRNHMSLIPFLWLIFTSGAVTSLVLLLVSDYDLTGYTSEGYFWVLMIAIFPQIIAHGSFNYLLAHFSATVVSISSQIITVISAVGAFFIFAELPGPLQFIGSAIIIVGVTLTLIGQSRH
ncbi:MAG: hypothetical protein CL610_04800 [Anaerolineaceae bacterium]|nr:hypothetical protein [Anaerolineaceae bacterium]